MASIVYRTASRRLSCVSRLGGAIPKPHFSAISVMLISKFSALRPLKLTLSHLRHEVFGANLAAKVLLDRSKSH